MSSLSGGLTYRRRRRRHFLQDTGARRQPVVHLADGIKDASVGGGTHRPPGLWGSRKTRVI